MNRIETASLVTIIQESYPNYYKGYTDKQTQTMIDIWSEVLNDVPFNQAKKALFNFLKTSNTDFPPTAGKIRRQAVDDMTRGKVDDAMQAWNTTRKAIQNSAWSDDAFESLPPLCREVVGSADTLRQWGQMQSETVGSVIMSQFIKAYNGRVEKHMNQILVGATDQIGYSTHSALTSATELLEMFGKEK